MTRFLFPVPNGRIYGASLKIQNIGDKEISGVYADCGLFVVYNDGSGSEIPLVTAGKNLVISPGQTITISAKEPEPWQPNARCYLAVDSTSLPVSCLLTASVMVGVNMYENGGEVV